MSKPTRPPRQRRKDARPQELIEAALQLFSQQGFAGTKIDDIAKSAGVAKGTVYLYFATKEALFEAAVRENISPIFANIEAMSGVDFASTAELLETIIYKIYSELLESPTRRIVIQILITEGSRFPLLAEFYYNEIVAKAKAMLRRVIKYGIDTGELRETPVVTNPEIIMAPAIMAAVWLLNFNHVAPINLKKFAKSHADLVINGLLTK